MATIATQYPGNLALQTEVWTLTLTEARAVCKVLHAPKGSYWENNAVKPTRRAARAKAATVRLYTAGLSTGEFSNALYASGNTITRL